MDYMNEMTFDSAVIKLVGIGGGGNNAVDRMIKSNLDNIEFIKINTDKHCLIGDDNVKKVQIGEKLTNGQGAGSDPNVGKLAAEESRSTLANALAGANTVFITAGMGGGTGTGAAPVVAEIAHETGALTIGVVTTPFKFEGAAKMRRAEAGIKELLQKVDTLFVIPNERIKQVSEQTITFANAFEIADSVLLQAVAGIANILRETGRINIDYADLVNTLKNSGMAHLGVGRGDGSGKVNEAAENTMYSRLMDTSVNGARRIIVYLTLSEDIGLEDVEKFTDKFRAAADPDVNLIFGYSFDNTLADTIKAIVIATDFAQEDGKKEPKPEETARTEDETEYIGMETSPKEEADKDNWDSLIDKIFKKQENEYLQ